ncbi:MAG: hypothetical protein WCI31_09500 [Prolixibacteraceae bacterium]
MKDSIANEKALTMLLEKYNIKPLQPFHLYKKRRVDSLQLLPGYNFEDSNLEKHQIPLLSWRFNRKFLELKRIVDNAIVEDVYLFRFCCMGSKDNWSLSSLLYREMDLFEFIGNSKIISVQAVISDDQVGSVILRSDNNVLCSIEFGVQIPSGTTLLERHEIIANRGVTSDLIVDAQIPQSSIYTYTHKGESRYTDVDMELFGFDDLDIDHIRSAFHVLKNPDFSEQLRLQHKHLFTLIQMVFESNRNADV